MNIPKIEATSVGSYGQWLILNFSKEEFKNFDKTMKTRKSEQGEVICEVHAEWYDNDNKEFYVSKLKVFHKEYQVLPPLKEGDLDLIEVRISVFSYYR